MLRPRRHLLLRPAPRPRSARLYHPDPYHVGQSLRVRDDIVIVQAVLPFQQPRVRAGSLVRVLRPLSDPTVDEMYYRFEVLDPRGRGSGWWSLAGASRLEAVAEEESTFIGKLCRWLGIST